MSDPLIDLAIETAYLGGVLSSGGEELERYPVPPDDMAAGAHQLVLGACLAIRNRAEDISHLSVRVELQRQGRLVQVGDEALMRLGSAYDPDQRASASRIRELAALRRAREAARRAAGLAEAYRLTEARSIMQEASLDTSGAEDDPILSFRDVMVETVEAWQAIARGDGNALALGMHAVADAAISALPAEGDVVIVAARPGVGKSSLVDKALLSLAQRGISVGKVSVEDGASDFGSKSLAALANQNPSVFWHRTETNDQGEVIKGPSRVAWNRMQTAAGLNVGLPIRFAKVKSNRIDSVLSRMTVMARAFGCKVIAVDYVQRIRGGQGKDTREQINDVIGSLVAAARQLGVVLLLVSQLKRPDTGNPFREPNETDLKESGSLEEVAQGLVLLWRKTDDPHAPNYGLVYGKVGKVKRGEAGQRFLMARDRVSGVLVERDLVDDDDA